MLQVKFLTIKCVLQVDSITETSALHQEAYILFYVRQGKFPWFSNLPSPMSALDNGHDVFAYHNLGKEFCPNDNLLVIIL